jgi:hypothetical protein
MNGVNVILPHFAEAFYFLLAGKLGMRSTLFSNAPYQYIELVKLANISKGGPFASNVLNFRWVFFFDPRYARK